MVSHGKFVAYYRVSTARQGRSGLASMRSAKRLRPISTVVAGASSANTPKSRAASGLTDRARKGSSCARLHKAALVVAKVDRLTRSTAFLSRLLEAGVDVRFCDLPQIEGPTGRFMLQQLVAVASSRLA